MIPAQVGEADAALDEIERLLSGPLWMSVRVEVDLEAAPCPTSRSV